MTLIMARKFLHTASIAALQLTEYYSLPLVSGMMTSMMQVLPKKPPAQLIRHLIAPTKSAAILQFKWDKASLLECNNSLPAIT
jgi:hypothetical protein